MKRLGMKCPFRKSLNNEYRLINGANVLFNTTESFENCYEEDCPYFSRHLVTRDGNGDIINVELWDCLRVNSEVTHV